MDNVTIFWIQLLTSVVLFGVVVEKDAPAGVPSPGQVAKMAEAYMRTSGTAIREMPIV